MPDLALNPDGTLAFPLRILDGPELVVQRVRIRLNTFRGEWLLNERAGIPWIEWISEPPGLTVIQALLLERIASTRGVARVEEFAVTQAPGSETYTITGNLVLETEDPAIAIEAELDPVQGAVRVVSATS